MSPSERIRVVVADDSGLMRQILSSGLSEAGFDVVGQARDGDEALSLCSALRPDAMTLDLAMPGLDGMGVLRELQRPGATQVPVVVVSAFSPAHGARAVDALAEGAFDLVAKPSTGQPVAGFLVELSDKIRAAAASQARRGGGVAPRLRPRERSHRTLGTRARTRRLVVIACSTGGPRALAELMPKLPPRLGEGTLIVQHMPPGFTGSLAARLDRDAPLRIAEAAGGEFPDPAAALLAPGGRHLRIAPDRRLSLSDEPAVGGLRPRADLTIADAAKLYGGRMLLVVLTGMGKDGLEGARAVRAAGGRVLAEAESTCTVYGMPRAVAEADLAHAVLPLDALPAAIAEEAGT